MVTPSSQDSAPDDPDSAHAVGLPWGRIVLLVVALVALVLLGRSAGAYVPQFAAWVESLGVLGPIAFVAGYALAVVLFIPGSILTLAAGAIFGLAEGTFLVFLAAVLGSTLAFLVARHGARRAIERRIEGDQRFAAIDQAIGAEGRKIVFLLRLSPVFPFNLLNYALGLTQVTLVDYLIASLGMLPGTLLYVYLGKLGGDVAAVAGGVETETGAGEWAIRILGFAATLVVTLIVTRIARRALDGATADAAERSDGLETAPRV